MFREGGPADSVENISFRQSMESPFLGRPIPAPRSAKRRRHKDRHSDEQSDENENRRQSLNRRLRRLALAVRGTPASYPPVATIDPSGDSAAAKTLPLKPKAARRAAVPPKPTTA
jgi:hypothetical protein